MMRSALCEAKLWCGISTCTTQSLGGKTVFASMEDNLSVLLG